MRLTKPIKLNDISEPVEAELKEFNKYFKTLMSSDVPLLDLIVQYLTKKKGKQIRPLLVFLSAELCGGVNKRTYTGAALVEFLHTATLVHDDVVDEAGERRGIASINAAWNNKIAVLIGDFLLAKGLLSSLDNNEFEFLKATSQAVRRMSEGELLQIQKSRETEIDLDTYLKIISNKTASLMSSCCEIGAISATDEEETRTKLKKYGEALGGAFQIKDDIFDYQKKSALLGKPVGNDLKERKITLPLIYALEKGDRKYGKKIRKSVKKGDLSGKEIEDIVSFVKDLGGIKYAESVAKDYARKAERCIEDLEEGPAKDSLIGLTEFVVKREK